MEVTTVFWITTCIFVLKQWIGKEYKEWQGVWLPFIYRKWTSQRLTSSEVEQLKETIWFKWPWKQRCSCMTVLMHAGQALVTFYWLVFSSERAFSLDRTRLYSIHLETDWAGDGRTAVAQNTVPAKQLLRLILKCSTTQYILYGIALLLF